MQQIENISSLRVFQRIMLLTILCLTVILNVNAQCIVNLSNTHQIIRGFGAANIMPWRPDMSNSEIQRLSE